MKISFPYEIKGGGSSGLSFLRTLSTRFLYLDSNISLINMTDKMMEDYVEAKDYEGLSYYLLGNLSELKDCDLGVIQEVLTVIYEDLSEALKKLNKECENCGETACEWLEYNDGICCKDNGDLEYPKYCSPCVEDKTADMTDTARDIEKDRML